jgi:CRP/FNR family transcriptional regulator, cyclic AMP receptor protein
MSTPSTLVSPMVLRTVPMFGTFPDEQLRALATMISRRSVGRGAPVMHAGDASDCLYVVLSGRLKVMLGEADGKEMILSILGPGEFFGEMGLIDESPRSASVVAIEPCELLAMTKGAFRKCLVENTEVAMSVLRVVVKRLREADRKVGSLAMLDVYGRVARLLLDMSEEVNGQKVVVRRLTKQDIGKMVGASREMVTRVMKDLETSGYFEVRGSTIVLRDAIPPAT